MSPIKHRLKVPTLIFLEVFVTCTNTLCVLRGRAWWQEDRAGGAAITWWGKGLSDQGDVYGMNQSEVHTGVCGRVRAFGGPRG